MGETPPVLAREISVLTYCVVCPHCSEAISVWSEELNREFELDLACTHCGEEFAMPERFREGRVLATR